MMAPAFHSLQAQESTALVVWHSDGNTTEVLLSSKPKVVLAEEKVVIKNDEGEMEFDAKDIRRLTYKGEDSGIESVKSKKMSVLRQGDRLIFKDIGQSSDIRVYSVSGQRVSADIEKTGDGLQVSLASLPKGVYMICVEGRNIKFSKR